MLKALDIVFRFFWMPSVLVASLVHLKRSLKELFHDD